LQLGSANDAAGLRRMVLRKKPPGKILASAHAVEREFTVLAALSSPNGNGVPVPRPLALCHDPAVLGTPFYLMEFSEGSVFLVRTTPAGGWKGGSSARTYSARDGALSRLLSSCACAMHPIHACMHVRRTPTSQSSAPP
jgi:aminoglycoside phosphotransferase (APT) family kinase protein